MNGWGCNAYVTTYLPRTSPPCQPASQQDSAFESRDGNSHYLLDRIASPRIALGAREVAGLGLGGNWELGTGNALCFASPRLV
jgi:hypothetical protein